MRYIVLAMTLVTALALPACSKSDSSSDSGPAGDLRAHMQQAREDARTSCMQALSSTEKTKVDTIIAAFNGGSLSMDQAATQIDGILTPAESQAVLAEQEKMRETIRQAAQANGMGTLQGRRNGSGHRPPDAGRFLVMIAGAPDRVRASTHRRSE
jgi:hypothetical protein